MWKWFISISHINEYNKELDILVYFSNVLIMRNISYREKILNILESGD